MNPAAGRIYTTMPPRKQLPKQTKPRKDSEFYPQPANPSLTVECDLAFDKLCALAKLPCLECSGCDAAIALCCKPPGLSHSIRGLYVSEGAHDDARFLASVKAKLLPADFARACLCATTQKMIPALDTVSVVALIGDGQITEVRASLVIASAIVRIVRLCGKKHETTLACAVAFPKLVALTQRPCAECGQPGDDESVKARTEPADFTRDDACICAKALAARQVLDPEVSARLIDSGDLAAVRARLQAASEIQRTSSLFAKRRAERRAEAVAAAT